MRLRPLSRPVPPVAVAVAVAALPPVALPPLLTVPPPQPTTLPPAAPPPPLLRVDPPPCLLLALLPLAVLWEVRDLLKLRSAVTTSACAAGRRQRDAAAATV